MSDEEEHEHAHGLGIGLVLEMNTETGEVSMGGRQLPNDLASVFGEMLLQAKTHEMAREFRQFVTPEIANHVLSAFGDERASMPSMSVAALISLIRTCQISDEELMETLNQASAQVHGYVLATTLVEPKGDNDTEGGLLVLRQIAGLDEGGGGGDE